MFLPCFFLWYLQLFDQVSAGGTVQFGLKRYMNDRCQGEEPLNCYYLITLTINPGSQYNLTYDLDPYISRTGSILFLQSLNETDQVLNDLTNPFPIRPGSASSVASVRFTVRNSISWVLFENTQTFNVSEMVAGVETTFLVQELGAFYLGWAVLRCDPGFTGSHCLECEEENTFGPLCNCSEGPTTWCDNETGEQHCRSEHYGDSCEVHCKAEVGRYECSAWGNPVCVHPYIGLDCSTLSECGEGRFGPPGCGVVCEVEPGRKLCDVSGRAVCEGHYMGENCTECVAGYYGQECGVRCVGEEGRYACRGDGSKACLGNWMGEQCDQCAQHFYSPLSNCETFCVETERYSCNSAGGIRCSEGWYGIQWQCNCTETPRWTCDTQTGERICKGMRAGPECQGCRTGWVLDDQGSCTTCKPGKHYTCENDEKKCHEHYYGANCDIECIENAHYFCSNDSEIEARICKGHYRGEPECTECWDNYYNPNCSVWCMETDRVKCYGNGSSGCKDNFYSYPECDKYCDASVYICDSNGTAIGCAGNRTAASHCQNCTEHHYGQNCNKFCKPKKDNFQCNSEGEEICVERFTGENCEDCAKEWFTIPGGKHNCSIWCVDSANYTCTIEGYLVMNADYQAEVLNQNCFGVFAAEYNLDKIIYSLTAFICSIWCAVVCYCVRKDDADDK